MLFEEQINFLAITRHCLLWTAFLSITRTRIATTLPRYYHRKTKSSSGGFDYGNAAADLNPDDIASINVLELPRLPFMETGRPTVLFSSQRKGKNHAELAGF